MKKSLIFGLFLILVLFSTSVFAGNGIMDKDRPQGLENAMIQINNENAYSYMVQNLNQFRNRYNFTCDSDCSIDLNLVQEKTQLVMKNKERFLLWDVETKNTFDLDEDGIIQKQTSNVWAWMKQRGLI